VLYAVVLFTNIIMNSVQSIKNLKTAVGLGFEKRKEIKQLGPPRPNLKICKQNLIKGKIVVRNFDRGMYNNARGIFIFGGGNKRLRNVTKMYCQCQICHKRRKKECRGKFKLSIN
jgi:hypothetical protein